MFVKLARAPSQCVRTHSNEIEERREGLIKELKKLVEYLERKKYPSDNKECNLIVFCRNHHARDSSGGALWTLPPRSTVQFS